jgi:hypothetical protein
MNRFMSLFRGGMLKKGLLQRMQAPKRNMLGKRTIMSLLAVVGGAVAYGVVRRRNGGRNLFQQITQPLRNRWFR